MKEYLEEIVENYFNGMSLDKAIGEFKSKIHEEKRIEIAQRIEEIMRNEG